MKLKKAIYFVLMISFFRVGLKAQTTEIDSLKMALKTASHDSSICSILEMLSEKADEAEWPRYNEELKIISEKNLKIKLPQRLKEKYLYYLAVTLNNCGVLSNNKGNIPEALDYHHRSLRIMEELGNKAGTGTSLVNMGDIYDEQGEIREALDCMEKANKIYSELKDNIGLAYSLNGLGFFYNKNGDPLCNSGKIICDSLAHQKALLFFKKALLLYHKENDIGAVAMSLCNIGHTFSLYTKEPEKAIPFYERAFVIADSIQDEYALSRTLDNLASYYYREGKYQKALDYGLKGLKLAKELGYPDNIKTAGQVLRNIYSKLGKYKEALEMYELFILMSDSVNNENTRRSSIRKQFQIDYEKESVKDSIANATKLREEKLKNEQDVKQQSTYTYGGLTGLAIMLLIAGVSFRAFKNKQKANIEINKQKQIAENQKHIIEEKQKELLDSINYARRIQLAHLPGESYIARKMKELKNKLR